MKLAFSHLSPFLPNLKHNCCLAHILNLIGETWVNFQKFELVDKLIMNVKTMFTYNLQRKICWKKHLIQSGVESPTLAPLPVKTQWNSWLINDLEFFKVPISNEIIQVLSKINNNINLYIPLFAKAFTLVYEKSEKHISQHPALLFFKAIQCFDPRFIQSNSSNHNMENYRIIKEFYLPTDTLIQEWAIYCGFNESIKEFNNLDVYWRSKIHILPELSLLTLIYIWLPVSGVDVEHSFSSYKGILSNRRVALKEESIQMLNFLYFNLGSNIDNYDLIE
uniref:HAT C-terminal dimerisation domain-containing protein n=1 Tax=Rhizophagus irregularis (strain DAOM 181602 / DAOM 197198 / MUCL 43194) TaxID=747089 RepID=U9UKA6_RHIID